MWLDHVTYTIPARRDLFSREGQRGTERHQEHELTVEAMLLPESRQYRPDLAKGPCPGYTSTCWRDRLGTRPPKACTLSPDAMRTSDPSPSRAMVVLIKE